MFMGILDRIRQTRSQREAERAEQEFHQQARSMDVNELRQLNSDELIEALLGRMQGKTQNLTEKEALEVLNEAQRTLYILKVFDEEVRTGGLLQFFVNDSRDLAPYVSSSLKAVRADPYTMFFDDFVDRNNIDLRDLSSFQIDNLSEYELNIGRYPFDDFDGAFYYENLKNPLERMLVVYAREHLQEM